MGSRQPDDAPGGVLVLDVAPATPSSSALPDDAPGGVLVLDVAPATPSSSALPDDAPDLPDNVTLFTRHYTSDTPMCNNGLHE